MGIVSFLLVAALLLSGAAAKRDTLSPATGDKQQRQPYEQEKVSDPSSLTGEIKVRSEPKTATTQNQSQDWYEWFWPPIWSSWALFFAALLAARIALRTLTAIDRQANIADRSLALSQRPRIKLQTFAINDDVFEPGGNGLTIDLGYEVVNYGGTDATITDSNCTILLRHVSEPSDLPPLPPYDIGVANRIAEPGTILKGGEACRFSKRQGIAPEREDQFGMGHLRVYVIGYLVYRGNVGPHYRIAFCRRLEREGFTPIGFTVVENSNYEYQD